MSKKERVGDHFRYLATLSLSQQELESRVEQFMNEKRRGIILSQMIWKKRWRYLNASYERLLLIFLDYANNSFRPEKAMKKALQVRKMIQQHEDQAVVQASRHDWQINIERTKFPDGYQTGTKSKDYSS